MRFFDREDKIERLRQIRARSESEAQFTVITGRRRVGKTELVQHAFADGGFVYLFVSRKSETELVEGFVRRDYPVFSGKTLESYFRAKLTESGEWTKIGNWWDRKDENELDLVAENELDGTLLVAEVKREAKRIDLAALKEKYVAFASAAGLKKSLKPEFRALSLEDM